MQTVEQHKWYECEQRGEERKDKQRWQLTANHRPNTDGAAFYSKRFIWVPLHTRNFRLNLHLDFLKTTSILLLSVQQIKRNIQIDFDCAIGLNRSESMKHCLIFYWNFRTKCATRSAVYCMLIKIRILYSKHALLCIHIIS